MFHLENGWYFSRENNGDVTILKREDAEADAKPITTITIDVDDWGSVVASVCVDGETRDSHRAALYFHNHGCGDRP